ncbi:hypothetical protein B0H15DRAFT_849193 [Mycena belliarum]|uniref:Uncharacterized protein n=1 Tax=Mycena belliarum TaxID=1033014 RepID=A0AAD6U163_9AGAR|nr:hypothetical protein B0H15DRAFT_849193 [Mycena belliae]
MGFMMRPPGWRMWGATACLGQDAPQQCRHLGAARTGLLAESQAALRARLERRQREGGCGTRSRWVGLGCALRSCVRARRRLARTCEGRRTSRGVYRTRWPSIHSSRSVVVDVNGTDVLRPLRTPNCACSSPRSFSVHPRLLVRMYVVLDTGSIHAGRRQTLRALARQSQYGLVDEVRREVIPRVLDVWCELQRTRQCWRCS